MLFYNGFSLSGEKDFFSDFLLQSELCVAGFSYGAQKAFEYVYATQKRVDRLILLSPAFFQTQRPSFIRTQLRYFEAGKEAYVEQFLQNISYPCKQDLEPFLHTGTKEELEALLTYRWDADKIEEVARRGTVIEVFLGAEDRIIDSAAAYDFFKEHVTTYWIKDAGHLLLERE
ncbi:pimelyl-ACP methyl ester esterase BioV [Sulfurovum riftiae]|uniref:AB hydrolase-1 domain-containing protein n=1 Tax=Sulfurovum riftiae TaxID=1630136 RepID=A0A151CIC5_9BACT|nr:pimelyl-ACP methyl ester esterase BioV [Sulfurovum riftiae]KYJ87247.1 hypothetical protein AS592_02590 [Sulfurovum riftiae]